MSTESGAPTEMIFTLGSVHGNKAFNLFDYDLPEGSDIYVDAAMSDYEHEDELKEIKPHTA